MVNESLGADTISLKQAARLCSYNSYLKTTKKIKRRGATKIIDIKI